MSTKFQCLKSETFGGFNNFTFLSLQSIQNLLQSNVELKYQFSL